MGRFGTMMVILIFLLTGCGQASAPVAEEKIKTVLVETATLSSLTPEITFHTLLEPQEDFFLDFDVGGTIKQLTKDPGGFVRRGTLLARLDTSQAEINRSRSQQQLLIAEANLTRLQQRHDELMQEWARKDTLFNAGALSQVELDMVIHQIRSLELDISQSQSQIHLSRLGMAEADLLLQKSHLYAPADLHILEIFFQEGQNVAAGSPVMHLGQLERLKAKIEVPIETRDRWQPGTTIAVWCRGESRTARVEKVAPTASLALGKLEVELAIPNSGRDWLAGELVEILQSPDQGEGILLPLESVLNQEKPYVYVVEEGIVRERAVSLGMPKGARIQVMGIDAGETVVVGGMENIFAGEKVETLNR